MENEQRCEICDYPGICCDADDSPRCANHCQHPNPPILRDGLGGQERGE